MQKSTYEMRISDWRSDVCASDLAQAVFDNERARPDRRAPKVKRILGAGWLFSDDVERRQRIQLVRQANRHRHRSRGHLIALPDRLVVIAEDRKSVVKGKSVSVRVDLGGRRIIKKKTHNDPGRHGSRRTEPR